MIKIPSIDTFDDDDQPSTSSFRKFKRTEPDIKNQSENRDVELKDSLSPTSYSKHQASGCDRPSGDVSNEPKQGLKSAQISSRSVTVSGRQKGNPLLRFLRNVPWEWGDSDADYQINPSCCVLFLSVKFHKLNPDYVHKRFKKIGRNFYSQILLLLVDVEEADNVLRELNAICYLTNCWTLILCWSYEECAEYIESLKIYENKPMEFLMTNENRDKQEADDRTILIELLTSIRSVTKTDAENLIDAFGSLLTITQASVEQLALCRGVGLLKAQRIYEAFDQPFVCNKTEATRAGDDNVRNYEAASDMISVPDFETDEFVS